MAPEDESLDVSEIAEGEAQSVEQKREGLFGPLLIRILQIALAIIGVIFISVATVIISTRVLIPEKRGIDRTPTTQLEEIVKEPPLDYFHLDNTFRQRLLDREQHFVSIKISLGFRKGEKQILTELSDRETEIRDIVIRHLSKLDFSYFNDTNALDNLRNDLIKQINNRLINGKILNIYFSDYTLM